MTRIAAKFFACAAAIAATNWLAGSASALEIATGKPITGETSSWGVASTFDPGRFNSTHAVDGKITEPVDSGGSGEFEWLGADGVDGQSFTIDLGGQFDLSQISLYNTHNGQFNDSGSIEFRVLVGNTLAPGGNTPGTIDGLGQLLSGGTVILDSVLAPTDSQAVIIPQVFSVGAHDVRYVSFVYDTHEGPRGGLNEIQIQGAPVPEPSTLLVVGLSLGLFGAYRWRHRRIS